MSDRICLDTGVTYQRRGSRRPSAIATAGTSAGPVPGCQPGGPVSTGSVPAGSIPIGPIPGQPTTISGPAPGNAGHATG